MTVENKFKWNVFEHPPHIPDLDPSNFFRFSYGDYVSFHNIISVSANCSRIYILFQDVK